MRQGVPISTGFIQAAYTPPLAAIYMIVDANLSMVDKGVERKAKRQSNPALTECKYYQ